MTGESDHHLIGYLLHGHRVLCVECHRHPSLGLYRYVPLFRVNIGSYKQTCHRCGTTLVEGQTPAWPELFSR